MYTKDNKNIKEKKKDELVLAGAEQQLKGERGRAS
jgi:hypothetical protein